MDWTWNMHGANEKYLQNFGQKISEETT